MNDMDWSGGGTEGLRLVVTVNRNEIKRFHSSEDDFQPP